MQGTKNDKCKITAWREKAKKRRQENEALKKRKKELAKWAYEKLQVAKDENSLLTSEMQGKITWLITYESFIEEIFMHCQTMNKLFKILKHQGLNEQSKKACEDLLKKSTCNDFFQDGVKQYLQKI